MWFSPIFERFVEKSPVTVIVRALMEVVLAESKLDDLFENRAQTGYTRELLFSTLVKMMTQVVCSVRQSIGAVYKAMSEEIGVSKSAVYDKLNRLEPNVSKALVKSTAIDLATIIHQLGAARPDLLPGYRVLILDGNLLTNLPETDAPSILVATLYRKRWTVETLFQVATENFNCVIKTLGYPRAALFSFCMALVAYNLFSTLKAVLASVHGSDCLEQLSYYYLADEFEGTYRGMMIALPSEQWRNLQSKSLTQLSSLLQNWAAQVNLKAFTATKRKPKQKKLKPPYDPAHPHVSTARLLAQNKKSRASPN